MENQLVRGKSVDRISSPEELHDYMRVTSPRLWIILGAIVVLLAGFILYAATVTIENKVQIRMDLASAPSSDKNDGEYKETDTIETTCIGYLPLSYKGIVQRGMEVRFGEETGKVDAILTSAEADEAEAVAFVIKMEHPYIPMPDGSYEAELVLETTKPISFLWN